MKESPPGFTPFARISPFTALIGPLYTKGEGAKRVIGLRAERKHCNTRGLVHGGVLATLADTSLGYTIGFMHDPPRSLVTASLTIDYAGSANEGDWLESHVDVQKVGSRLVFANCYIVAAGERIARASAVFAVPGDRKAKN
ncbi:MAG: PaaI family thioesterase [Betaproteobacteria bacterium]|nr:PaaI family thioesterase [Betaproteobacteria bacterium]